MTTLAQSRMPLPDFVVSETGAAEVTVILSVQSGTLYADPAPGATVVGGGSRSLWIAGSADQVNAKLQSLIYDAGTPGNDRLSVTMLDSLGQVPARGSVPVIVLPPASDPAMGASLGSGMARCRSTARRWTG